jgi:hypothetical protein
LFVSLGVPKRKSEMYAYELFLCITKDKNQHVKQFWKYYTDAGVSSFRFRELLQKCPNVDPIIENYKTATAKEWKAYKPGISLTKRVLYDSVSCKINYAWLFTI